MEDVLNDLQESSTPEVEVETTQQSEVVAKAEFDKLYARTKKAETENKLLKERRPEQVANFDIEEIVDLRTSGYSKQEIDYMKAMARGRGQKSLSELAADPFVVAGINGLRAKAQTTAATPTSSSRPAMVTPSGKTFKEMSSDERKASFSQMTEKFRSSGRSNE